MGGHSRLKRVFKGRAIGGGRGSTTTRGREKIGEGACLVKEDVRAGGL